MLANHLTPKFKYLGDSLLFLIEMKWGVVLACLLLLASTASAGGSTKTVVAILNSNPEVKAIYVTDGLQLLEGQKVDLWCNATIKDKNGVLDLNATRVVIQQGAFQRAWRRQRPLQLQAHYKVYRNDRQNGIEHKRLVLAL